MKGALTLNTLMDTEPGVRPLLLLGSLGGASAGSAVMAKAFQVSLSPTGQLLCDAQAPAAGAELLSGCTPWDWLLPQGPLWRLQEVCS